MHHVRHFFLCGIMTFLYYVMFIHNVLFVCHWTVSMTAVYKLKIFSMIRTNLEPFVGAFNMKKASLWRWQQILWVSQSTGKSNTTHQMTNQDYNCKYDDQGICLFRLGKLQLTDLVGNGRSTGTRVEHSASLYFLHTYHITPSWPAPTSQPKKSCGVHCKRALTQTFSLRILYITHLTVSTKSPGLLWLSLTRKLPFFPLSNIIVSASLPDMCPWNHLRVKYMWFFAKIFAVILQDHIWD